MQTMRVIGVCGLVFAGVMFVFTGIQSFAFAVLCFGVGIIADGLLREAQD